ncbi:hypothetical protein [Pelagibius sp.]|uniref:hypothetical protein n=1 Tax=Pelagibius sp. TaxID=1931238 RepID=UPI002631583F|nr:hypothetical protein [Pelagibius sp.]
MRCLERRFFLTGMLLLGSSVNSQASPGQAGAGPDWSAVEAGGLRFRWRHRDDALQGRLSAPTAGWLAVGFNDVERLKGTCFVIAQVSQAPTRVALHRAIVPTHAPVADAEARAALIREGASFAEGRSHLGFRLPHRSGKALGVRLTPGAASYLMLAWSHATDFTHHSAFRGHRWVTL